MKLPGLRSLTWIATAVLLGGCMSWRTVCLEPSRLVGREFRTAHKYEIVGVRYETGMGPAEDAKVENEAEKLLGSAEAWDRIMQYRPGVFESRGTPATLVVRKWNRTVSGEWTWAFPFALTATLIPAFVTEKTQCEIEVEVSGMDSGKAAYRGVCDWHMTCLSPLGRIPYSQPEHPSACLWERNEGAISLEPSREGIADAIAKALMHMESKTTSRHTETR